MIYRGVRTTSFSESFSIFTQSFKEFKILPVKSRCKLLSKQGIISLFTCSNSVLKMLMPFFGFQSTDFLNTPSRRPITILTLSASQCFACRKASILLSIYVPSLFLSLSFPHKSFASRVFTPFVLNPAIISPQNRYSFSFVESAVFNCISS